MSSKFIGIKEAEGWSAIIQSLPKLKILSEEELKTFKYCKSSGIQLNLSKKMPKRGRSTQKLICFAEFFLKLSFFPIAKSTQSAFGIVSMQTNKKIQVSFAFSKVGMHSPSWLNFCFNYFEHLLNIKLEEMIPHLKAWIFCYKNQD